MTILSPLVLVAVWVCLPNSECPEFEEASAWVQQAKDHQKAGQYAAAETLLRRVLKTNAAEGGWEKPSSSAVFTFDSLVYGYLTILFSYVYNRSVRYTPAPLAAPEESKGWLGKELFQGTW